MIGTAGAVSKVTTSEGETHFMWQQQWWTAPVGCWWVLVGVAEAGWVYLFLSDNQAHQRLL